LTTQSAVFTSGLELPAGPSADFMSMVTLFLAEVSRAWKYSLSAVSELGRVPT